MHISEFDFFLPAELIAQFPPERRRESRLLHINGATGTLADRMFTDFPELVRAGDVLVLNDTRVIKARLFATKDTGGKVEVLIERVLDSHHALALLRASHAPKAGSFLRVDDDTGLLVEAREGDLYRVHLRAGMPLLEWLEIHGSLPLPPYIERAPQALDEARYQTVYATRPGAVAAPTAGLHFDEDMLATLQENGVVLARVTLHVGAGTFQPVRVEDVRQHRMHSEWYEVPEQTVAAIEQARARGGRVLAVGTTSLRALEAAAASGTLTAGFGETNLFIVPGYRFRVVERLLTNFHLPRSTLFMLVCAFGGINTLKHAYAHAVEMRYRFFSYGDATLIERAPQ
ncbi:tRNA preQ1(34) S-adenosylmethionine ribosyltransferase-isomerase QueA [Thiobacter sp. AK1]|uniref:S-adenosylmethionine:tRNA ribosyltransferase-isomerase n=2 Tax=Thiobacter aerophilum TaxID=3121275 RepID=A0ABV0EEX2_9BURK